MSRKHRKTAWATGAKTRSTETETRSTEMEQSSNNALEVLMNVENRVKGFAKPKVGRPKLSKISPNLQEVIDLTLSVTINVEPTNNKNMS